MSVWLAIPSAKAPSEWSTIPLWLERGYKVAVFRDAGSESLPGVHLEVFGEYRGYAASVNHLARLILKADPDADWIVSGGDDIAPDPKHIPEEIAKQCSDHFFEYWERRGENFPHKIMLSGAINRTFGVMQATGDRWMVNPEGLAATERVCESPWMGRSWCERSYSGNGPMCEDYRHFFVDEDLHEVAKKLGVLWHRPDLMHYHHHWSREGKPRPPYLTEAKLNWPEALAIFDARKRTGFPGSEPLAA
jgi:hypothetical protein